MLPSALDPLGRKIRRITTDVVDSDEQLLLVKRRASVAKAIALQGCQQSAAKNKRRDRASSRSSSSFHLKKKSCSAVDAPMSPDDFTYLKVIGVGAWGRVVLVRNRRDGALYAMKVISKRSVAENNLAEKILSERDVLGGTHHHSLGAIENASNFDVEFTRLSIGSIDTASCNGVDDDEFKEFDFEAPEAPLIEYGYARDIGIHTNAAGMCA
uniref:non-specific serine/threonine protein kinase n=1 Tax=Globisporangium ultimum (strain ATCC 200006 / CBS 805.95 / DAOM BR144) TaxID=431595 RepID=K3X424_GLOUD